MTIIAGIDVSNNNGGINWAKVAASGIQFAFAKVSQGSTFKDVYYASNVAGMRGAGIIPGSYHYLTATSNASSQAANFVALADPATVHALDVEEPRVDVAGWVAAYRAHYPRKPLLVYTGAFTWATAAQGRPAVNGAGIGPLWGAGPYLGGRRDGTVGALLPRVPSTGALGSPFGGWTSRALHQFTDRATVPGVAGQVDANVFYGTTAQFRALIGGSQVAGETGSSVQADITDDSVMRIVNKLNGGMPVNQGGAFYRAHDPDSADTLLTVPAALSQVLARLKAIQDQNAHILGLLTPKP
jgi:lysozyme